jgi:aminopeptidase N
MVLRYAAAAFLLVGGAQLLPAQGDSLMAPGVPQALARYRAERIRDVRYDLVLDVTEGDTARGRVAIRFLRRRAGDVIVDFRGPVLRRVRINGRALGSPDYNGAHLRIPDSLTVAGENRLDAEFHATVAAAGASILRVKDPADGETYLYTLLVPADAHQLFPCFDQPDLKARVSLTLTTPRPWKAVANGARLSADTTSRGVVHVFRETEPLSTYLIAFAAGPWAELRTTGTRRPITLYVRRSRAREVEADSIILANDRAATWLEDYFGSPLPFHKLDLVLAPAFPFGGMEHPGAIFYSEERFVFRERPTLPQRLGRASTIYHEIAHQWFGNLVTMEWFDDLWLKEGFSTYMAAHVLSALDPSAESWKTFFLRNKPPAYAVDVTEGTTPVWQQLHNLDQAKSNYGAIVYNKAPGILKQLHQLVGDSAFRAGLQRFLRTHAFGTATWRDLLQAIGSESGRNLSAWGDAYILRPGMPVLQQRLVVQDERVVSFELVQRPARPLSGPAPWPVHLELLVAGDSGPPQRLPLTVTAETTVVHDLAGRPAPAWIHANGRDLAYGLVLLDPRSTAALERRIGESKDALQRALLWVSLWDLVREAMLSPERFIRVALRELPREADEEVANAILGRLARATRAYLGDVQRDALGPDVERVLLLGARDPGRPYGLRKAHLDTYIRVAASPQAMERLDAMLDSATVAGDTLRPPTRWNIVTRLQMLGAPSADRRLAEETARDTTAEGARRAFVAGAARVDAATKRAYFARYFNDPMLNEDWVTASLEAFNSIEAQVLTRQFLPAALDSLAWIQQHRRIFFLGAWLGAFLDGQTDEEAPLVVRSFLASRPDLPADLRAKVLQAADELERTVRIRRAFALSGAPAAPE